MKTQSRRAPGAVAVLLISTGATMAGITPTRLRCEYAENPLGIDAARPRLSWALESSERGQVQTAYQVLVAGSEQPLASGRGDLWDSGKVASSRQIEIEYAGTPLQSGQRVWWTVRVWDRNGKASDYSRPARWEMGLLRPEDWHGRWIRRDEPAPAGEKELYDDHPAPMFRRAFTVAKKVSRARAYVSGLGYYELRINGARVGDHMLDPGWTTYSKRVLYSAYDVTPMLHEGPNVIGAIVGNGWYNPLPLRMWGSINPREHLTIGPPRLIVHLSIEYTDSTRETIGTDESWKVGDSPILRNSVYLGEVYDARRERPGWDRSGFDDAGWQNAVFAVEPVGPLRAQTAEPIRVTQTLRPVNVTEPRPGVFIFDMGQNYAGWVTLRVTAPADTRIALRYGELLHPDGTLNVMTSVCGQIKREGMGGPGAPPLAYQGDTYICRGGGPERYTPRFTFHGFRYVEVTGLPDKPSPEAVVGLRLNADAEEAGTFACSNEMFNRIHEIVRWTLQSNMFSVQSDCPHREKFGYGGDIIASGEMAMLNLDMARFYAKAVQDLADAARPNGGMTETAPFVGIADEGLGEKSGPVCWGTAFPWLQWQLYRYYGNRRMLEEQYGATKRWMRLVESKAVDGILDNGISDHESLVPKPRALTGTAFYHLNARLLSQIAAVLGHSDDAARYADLAERIQAAFNRRFLKPGTGRYDTATQACQAFALYMDLVPPAERAAALDVLVKDILETHKGHLSTGIFGTKYMLNALTDAGRADVAYAVVNQKTFPGWGHMLAGGATTLWEHWEFSDNVFSHNHPMFGSVSEWLFKAVVGIGPDPAAVGFDRVVIRPCPVGDLTWAKGGYRSVRGPVTCEWKIDGGTFALNVSIPPNATATVWVPGTNVTEGGVPAEQAEGVRPLRTESGTNVYTVGAGRYQFASRTAGGR